MSTDTLVLAAQTLAQIRWLVAALRTEDHEGSREDCEGLARRIEQTLIGTQTEQAERLTTALTRSDAVLLVLLAQRHEQGVYSAEMADERAAHRGRARRYRDIAQFLSLLARGR